MIYLNDVFNRPRPTTIFVLSLIVNLHFLGPLFSQVFCYEKKLQKESFAKRRLPGLQNPGFLKENSLHNRLFSIFPVRFTESFNRLSMAVYRSIFCCFLFVISPALRPE